jgi:hypothetical protein
MFMSVEHHTIEEKVTCFLLAFGLPRDNTSAKEQHFGGSRIVERLWLKDER